MGHVERDEFLCKLQLLPNTLIVEHEDVTLWSCVAPLTSVRVIGFVGTVWNHNSICLVDLHSMATSARGTRRAQRLLL